MADWTAAHDDDADAAEVAALSAKWRAFAKPTAAFSLAAVRADDSDDGDAPPAVFSLAALRGDADSDSDDDAPAPAVSPSTRAGSSGSGAGPDAPKWACDACTFLNLPSDAACDVCDAPRPGAPPPPPPRAEEAETQAFPGAADEFPGAADEPWVSQEPDAQGSYGEAGSEAPPDDARGDDVCATCGGSTLLPGGGPMRDVLVCDTCDAEVHFSCSGLARMPRDDEPFACADCAPAARRPERKRRRIVDDDEGLFDDDDDDDGRPSFAADEAPAPRRAPALDEGLYEDDEGPAPPRAPALDEGLYEDEDDFDDDDDEVEFCGVFSQGRDAEDAWDQQAVESDDDVVDLTTDDPEPRPPRRAAPVDDYEFDDIEDDFDDEFDGGGADHVDDVSGPLAAFADTFRSVRWLRKRGRSKIDYDDFLVDKSAITAGLRRLSAAREKRAREGPKAKPKRSRKGGGKGGRGRGRGRGRKRGRG